MAAVTLGVATPSTVGATSYAAGTFTPAVGDLIVAYVGETGGTLSPTMTDDQGGTYTLISWNNNILFFIREQLVTSAVGHILTFSSTATLTGASIVALRVSGMTKTGIAARKQQKDVANGTNGTPPSATFTLAALTTNPVVIGVHNSTNPATLTAPTNWTERADIGYNSPTSGLEVCSRDSGFTGTVMTYGNNSTQWDITAIELDTSTNLVVQDGTHNHTADSFVLTQVHSLAVADASHAHAGDALALTQDHILAIDEALHNHTVDSLLLTQAHELAIAEALHSHTADNIILEAGDPYKVQNLIADAVSSSQINLTWDDVAALAGHDYGFDIERNSVVIISNHQTTSYNDTGLTAQTEYTYRVRAQETI